MTLPEPFAAVHADDLLLDRLAARRDPEPGSDDRAAEALLRLARAADDTTGIAETAAGPSTGTDSGTGSFAAAEPAPSTTVRRRRHAVIVSRLLVAAAASVALGLVPAAHDTHLPLPSPVLPAAPIALVRAEALLAQAQGLVSPPDAEPTTAGLDRAESLLAEAADLLDGVRDPVGGTLGVDAVRARMAGVVGALAAARQRLEAPTGVVAPVRGDGARTPVAAERGPGRGDGSTAGAVSASPRSPATGSRHDTPADSRDEAEDADESGPARGGGGTSGSTGGHEGSSSSAGRPTGTEHSGHGVGDDDEHESDDASESGIAPSTTRDGSGSEARSGDGSDDGSEDGSDDGSDDGATEPGPGADDGHESD